MFGSKNYGNPIEARSLNHDAIIFTHSSTGYCGSDGNDYHFIPAGSDLDDLCNEVGYENACSYGLETIESDDDEYEDNDNIECSAYHYQLSESGCYIGGGDPINSITKLIIDHGGVSLNDNKALLYASRLKQLVYIPDGKEWEEYNVLIEELKSSFEIEIVEIA